MANWGSGVHGGIATAIKQARHGQYTADALADQTSRLGWSITRSQIANYESGRTQSLDVTDLMVLAAALNVPALALLFPGLPDKPVAVLPGRSATTAVAKAAFVGDGGLLWPPVLSNEIHALMQALGKIDAAMGGTAGMGALTALAAVTQSPDGWSMNANEVKSQQHRPTPATTSPQEQPRRRWPNTRQVTVDDIRREEQELNAPLRRTPS